ncbi:MAG: DUF3237 domain-containing protein [Pseudohongiellaceae bacterium]
MNDNQRSLSRREFTRLGVTALAATSVGASTMATAQTAASALESEFLMELSLDVAAQLDAGHTSIAPVTGGAFGGPRIRGTVRDGGADWITQVSGHSSLDVRITLDTDDGAIIYMSYTGVVHPGENGLYWRVRPIFQTASEKYDWLNHIVCIGKSKQIQGKVAYDIFQIL